MLGLFEHCNFVIYFPYQCIPVQLNECKHVASQINYYLSIIHIVNLAVSIRPRDLHKTIPLRHCVENDSIFPSLMFDKRGNITDPCNNAWHCNVFVCCYFLLVRLFATFGGTVTWL